MGDKVAHIEDVTSHIKDMKVCAEAVMSHTASATAYIEDATVYTAHVKAYIEAVRAHTASATSPQSLQQPT